MDLFNLAIKRGAVDEKTVLDKINKAKTISVPTNTKATGPNLLQTIQKVKESMDTYLGDKKDNYELITTTMRLVSYFDHIIENGIYSVDTETTGLDPMQDRMVGFSVYTPGEKPAYVPVSHISYITKQKLEDQVPLNVVTEQFNRLIKANVKAIMFNSKFDIRVFRHSANVYMHVYYDGCIAARLLNENEPSNRLKDLYKKYILHGQEDAFTFGELFKGTTFDLIPPNIGYLYAARDAEVTWELFQFQIKYLTPDNPICIKQDLVDVSWVFWNIEMPAIEVLADIEDAGVMVDTKITAQLDAKYLPLIQSYSDAFDKKVLEYGITKHYDVSSSTQLAELFYDVLGLVSPDPEKPRGTGKEIISELNHPIVDAVKDYRSISTLVNTFVKKLPTMVDPNTGKIHCNYKQIGADTGRLACSDPNMQQIPNRGQGKEIRKMFCASPGCVLIGSDFSQQEPKLTAVVSKDVKMLESAMSGRDVYSAVAAIAFNTSYENCCEFFPEGTPIKHNEKHEWVMCSEAEAEKHADGHTDTNYAGKNRRAQAKSIVLGITYGRGITSIAEQLHTTKDEAQKIYDSVIATFVGLQDLKDKSEAMAREKGFVTTLWGRKRRLPGMQLPPYEISYTKEYSNATGQYNLPQNIKDYYMDRLNKCKGRKGVNEIISEARMNGIYIRSNSKLIARATRQCVNSRIQGSAADMTKLAMVKIANDPELKSLGFKMLIQVHDEIIGECPEANAEQASKRFAYVMSHAAEEKVPIPFSSDVVIEHHWNGGDVEEDPNFSL